MRAVISRSFALLFMTKICCLSAQGLVQNPVGKDSTIDADKIYKTSYKRFIVPSLLIGYGIFSLESDGLKQVNFSTREEINEHQPFRTKLDNYTQYAPALMVYGLNATGIKGRHNWRDRTIIYATSQVISTTFVIPLKHIVKEERPDASNRLSFPSGHTATAFSTAHFMFKEYKDTSFWLSVSGYPFAVFTGVYRVLNDKHWVNDVVAGAGFGILSTELAYWAFPKINDLISGRYKRSRTMIMPLYQNKGFGLSMVRSL